MTTEEYDFNPFESPQAPSKPTMANFKSKVKWAKPFASGHVRALVTMALLAIIAFFDAFGAWCCISRIALLEAIEHGQTPSTAEIASHNRLFAIAEGGNALALLVTGIAFLAWIHRSYRNLPALGAIRPESTPFMAAGWYFVPVAWFAMPYIIMAEIWGNSDPAQIDKRRKKSSPLVKIWWGFFLAHVAVWYLASMPAPERFAIDATKTRAASFAVEFIAAIVAILLVYRVDCNQQGKYEIIAQRDQIF